MQNQVLVENMADLKTNMLELHERQLAATKDLGCIIVEHHSKSDSLSKPKSVDSELYKSEIQKMKEGCKFVIENQKTTHADKVLKMKKQHDQDILLLMKSHREEVTKIQEKNALKQAKAEVRYKKLFGDIEKSHSLDVKELCDDIGNLKKLYKRARCTDNSKCSIYNEKSIVFDDCD